MGSTPEVHFVLRNYAVRYGKAKRFVLRIIQPQPITDTERKYVYGILGIAKLFGCSLPTANRIKKSGKIDKAITQIGRKIIVDVELALELAGKKTGGRK